MLAPIEMRRALPMTLHGSGVTMTTEVWSMLAASEAGDLERVARLVAHRPELRTCQVQLHLAAALRGTRGARGAGQRARGCRGIRPGLQELSVRRRLARRWRAIAATTRSRVSSRTRRVIRSSRKTWSETGNIDYRQDTEQARFDRALHDSKLREVDRLLTARPDLATQRIVVVGRRRAHDAGEEARLSRARVAAAAAARRCRSCRSGAGSTTSSTTTSRSCCSRAA